MATQYQEGQTATGPSGQRVVYRGGVWVALAPGPQSVTFGTPDPTYGSKIRKEGNEADASDFDPATKKANLQRTQQQIGDRGAERGDKLRSDYESTPAVKEYRTVLPILMSGLKAASNPQGDSALIYAYAKIMDPGSVVRESEGEAAANTAGFWEAKVEKYKKDFGFDQARGLPADAAAGLRAEMNRKVAALAKAYGVQRNRYQETAKRQDVNSDDVVGPFEAGPFMGEYEKLMGRDRKPILSLPGGIPNGPGPDMGTRVANPTGGNEYSTNNDKKFAGEAQAAFNAGASREQMDAIAARYNAPAFGADLDNAIIARSKGQMPRFTTPVSGKDDPTLIGKLAATPVGGAIGGLTDGVLFGGMDEITAAYDSATTGRPFDEALNEADERKRALRDASPWAFTAGNLAGGIGSAIGTGGLGLGARAPLLSDLAVGGLSGALSNNDDRLWGGAIGAGVGAGLGQAFRGVSNKFTPGQPSPGDRSILGSLSTGRLDQVRAKLDEAAQLDVPMSLADTDSGLTSLAGAAVRRSPDAKRIAEQELMPRSRGQVDRFGQAIERDLGPLANPMEQSAALQEQARAAAAPLYEQAYAAPVIGTPNLDAILNTPFGRQAIGKARNIAANERRNPEAMGFRLDAEGNVALDPTVPMSLTSAGVPGGIPTQQMGYTTQTMDYAKRGMDEVLEQYRNPITNRLDLTTAGRAENGVRSSMLNELDQLNPAYAEARAAYQGPMEMRDALAAGQDAMKQSPLIIGGVVSRMSPAEMQQMRLGYRSALSESGDKLRYSSNPFDGTLGTPAAEKRLSTIYGEGHDGAARLLRQRDLERDMSRTTNQVLGNSMTAERGIADQAFAGGIPGGVLDVGANLALGQIPVSQVARMAGVGGIKDMLKLGVGKNAERRASEMAPRLFQTDPTAALDTLDQILRQQAAFQSAQRIPSNFAGAIGGVLPMTAMQSGR